MRLIDTKILVKEVNKLNNITKAGLYIPEKDSKKYKLGLVIETGDGTEKEPMKIHKDEEILFSSFAGTEVIIGTEKYTVIDQKDVLVILN